MKVYQAIYGEDESHGHGLLRHSPASQAERVPFVDATHRTDLPGSPPSGTVWTPYLRSFVEGDFYVLTRTFPDPNARRRGMVRTHAIFLPLEHFCRNGHLSEAIELLRQPDVSPKAARDLETAELPSASPVDSKNDFPEQQYQAFIHAIVEGNGKLPIVWVGQEHFDAAVARLWEFLTPDLRKTFHFRISFSPRDVEETPPLIVCTPQGLASHWSRPYQTVTRSSGVTQISPSMDYLLGGVDGTALRALQAQLELVISSFRQLRDLSNIYTNLEGARRGGGIEPLDACIRLIAQSVPDSNCGSQLKSELLEQLSNLTVNSSSQELRALRNFPVAAFKQGDQFLVTTVEGWFRSTIRNPSRQPASGVAQVIREGLESQSLWARAVKQSITNRLKTIDSNSSVALWSWWCASSSLVDLLARYIPATHTAENELINTCPEVLTSELGNLVREFSAARAWLALHARAVSAYLPWKEAIALQVSIDYDEKHTQNIDWMCSAATGTEVLDVALALGDARLGGISAKRVATCPALKTSIDGRNPHWRRIWQLSIEEGVPPFEGVTHPAVLVSEVLDEVIAGVAVDELLLRHMSASYLFADLYEYPDRRRLWPLLSDEVREAFLLATADGWLRRFKTDPGLAVAPEPELRRTLVGSNHVRREITDSRSNAELILSFLRRFPDFPDPQALLTEWITQHPNVGRFEAVTVGAFVHEHRWHRAAELVVQQADAGRGEWDYGAGECSDLLGVLQRFFRKVKKGRRIAVDDWWNAWIELSSKLYAIGVRYRNIWERSGGELSWIDVNRDGYSQWCQALTILRQGPEGITVEGLLHQMRQDWPDNEKLEILERLWKRKDLH